MAMKTVVALPGQGTGPEVVDATCELLMGTGLPLMILTPPHQAKPLPGETKRAARGADGVLFGVAGPSTSHVVSWLRWEVSAWAGVRPIRFYPGMRSPLADPEDTDFILLRENSEGIYPGREGDLADLVKVLPDLSDRTGRKVKGMGAEAQRLDAAVGRVYQDGKTLTPDQGGKAKTREMAQAVLAAHQG